MVHIVIVKEIRPFLCDNKEDSDNKWTVRENNFTVTTDAGLLFRSFCLCASVPLLCCFEAIITKQWQCSHICSTCNPAFWVVTVVIMIALQPTSWVGNLSRCYNVINEFKNRNRWFFASCAIVLSFICPLKVFLNLQFSYTHIFG